MAERTSERGHPGGARSTAGLRFSVPGESGGWAVPFGLAIDDDAVANMDAGCKTQMWKVRLALQYLRNNSEVEGRGRG